MYSPGESQESAGSCYLSTRSPLCHPHHALLTGSTPSNFEFLKEPAIPLTSVVPVDMLSPGQNGLSFPIYLGNSTDSPKTTVPEAFSIPPRRNELLTCLHPTASGSHCTSPARGTVLPGGFLPRVHPCPTRTWGLEWEWTPSIFDGLHRVSCIQRRVSKSYGMHVWSSRKQPFICK